jgi:hypothetical protein
MTFLLSATTKSSRKVKLMPEHILIHSSQICEITEKGISYLDDSGEDGFIDFHQCYLNYLKPRLTVNAYERLKSQNPTMNFDPVSYANRIIGWKEIGHRNSLGDFIGTQYVVNYEGNGKPFAWFYTEPVLVFEFGTAEELFAFFHQIFRFGWMLWDET